MENDQKYGTTRTMLSSVLPADWRDVLSSVGLEMQISKREPEWSRGTKLI